MSQVAVYYDRKSSRGRSVMRDFAQGVAQAALGDKAGLYPEDTYRGTLGVECVALYGLSGNLMTIMQDYRCRNIPVVFFDLPYWGRKHEPSPQYHRFAINAYQPTAYFQQDRSLDRFAVFERPVCDWQETGEEILIAGMSEKQTQVWGLGASAAFHQAMVERVRAYTDRPIAWRPKPSCRVSGHPLPGTRFADGPLQKELQAAACVVTYRSNLALDGLLAGVPCLVFGDHPTEVYAGRHLTDLDALPRPTRAERIQLAADLAYCQASMQELRNGWAWRFIKDQIGAVMACA